jgi:hypothetical protein
VVKEKEWGKGMRQDEGKEIKVLKGIKELRKGQGLKVHNKILPRE